MIFRVFTNFNLYNSLLRVNREVTLSLMCLFRFVRIRMTIHIGRANASDFSVFLSRIGRKKCSDCDVLIIASDSSVSVLLLSDSSCSLVSLFALFACVP